jgi:hypothetical protein
MTKASRKSERRLRPVTWSGLDREAPKGTTAAVSITDFESRPVDWLWDGRIPLGKLTIVDGDPGLGKSVITNADIAARVTNGDSMPDGSDGLPTQRAVVLVVAEDDIADTVRPRLEAAGADLPFVFLLPVKRNSKGNVIPLNIPDDLIRLKEAIEDSEAALVIIDPITAFLGEQVNTHNDASVRKALGPLKELAEETGAAVVMIRHLNKSGDAKALYRGGGSIAFSGSARSGLMVERVPNDPEGWCALAQVKTNLSRSVKSILYKVVSVHEFNEDFPYDVPVVQWGEATELTADELFVKKDARKNAPLRDEAKQFLFEVLADGPTPVVEVQEQAKGAGIAWSTVKTASVELGVVKNRERAKDGKKVIKGWTWALPRGLKASS